LFASVQKNNYLCVLFVYKENMNRRQFIGTGLATFAGLSMVGRDVLATELTALSRRKIDIVKLGKIGLKVSRIALGTGTIGGNHESNQTRLGMEGFSELVAHAVDRGITFFDMADSYGSHRFVRQAIGGMKRKRLTLMTKMWTVPDGSPDAKDAGTKIDRYLDEIGSDYIDILLMHCMMEPDWPETRHYFMDEFSKAKEAGKVRAIGVSCHNLEALRRAAVEPWVDVILARINPFQTLMDGTPEEVVAILKIARDNGKGIVGMKIFGEGKNTSDAERQQSLEFAVRESHVHAMTIGLESASQVDDAVERVMKLI
jgi:aryl-alcohol dehydrogenase-like predicted oxidoreductase